jgi:hypothetical protein
MNCWQGTGWQKQVQGRSSSRGGWTCPYGRWRARSLRSRHKSSCQRQAPTTAQGQWQGEPLV